MEDTAESSVTPTSLTPFIATGGVSGICIGVVYILYKCFSKKKFHSKCCNGEMSIEEPQPQTIIHVRTPQGSPNTPPLPSAKTVQNDPLDLNL